MPRFWVLIGSYKKQLVKKILNKRSGLIATYFITKLEHTDLDFFGKYSTPNSFRLSRVFNAKTLTSLNTLLNLIEHVLFFFTKKSRSVCSNLVIKYVPISPERLFNIWLISCHLCLLHTMQLVCNCRIIDHFLKISQMWGSGPISWQT